MVSDSLQMETVLDDIYQYWRAIFRQRGTVPLRQDIDPLTTPTRSLPYIMLVDVSAGPRFRFRLVGTDAGRGADPTGRFLDEAAPEGRYRAHILALYKEGWEGGTPLYTISYYHGSSIGTHRLFLPLVSRPDREMDMMLVGQFSHRAYNTAPRLWELAPNPVDIHRALLPR